MSGVLTCVNIVLSVSVLSRQLELSGRWKFLVDLVAGAVAADDEVGQGRNSMRSARDIPPGDATGG